MSEDRESPIPKEPESIIPSLEMIILVYVVFVLFGFYLLYMYDPVSVHRLFSWLFNPFI